MVSFFAACCSINASHLFGHVLLDLHREGILGPLPTDHLENIEVLVLFDLIRLAGHDAVLCLLVFFRSQ